MADPRNFGWLKKSVRSRSRRGARESACRRRLLARRDDARGHPSRDAPAALHARLGPGGRGGSPWRRCLRNRTGPDRSPRYRFSGAYAEFICLPERELVPVPPGLDAAEAVSLILNYITAYQMLHRSAKVRPGQRVLIHGAAGGVGSALLQLGRLAGLKMYGTCSSQRASAVTELAASRLITAAGLRRRNSPPHGRGRRRRLRRHRWPPHLAFPQGPSSRR